MGGCGSGLWERRSKATVEDCLSICVGDLVRLGLIQTGEWASGRVNWNRPRTGELLSSARCESDARGAEAAWLRLSYTLRRERRPVSYTVSLTATRPHLGGVRWWFVCPLTAQGGECGRRVGKLYLPSGGEYYGCRRCYDLTYASCRRSHRRGRLDRLP